MFTQVLKQMRGSVRAGKMVMTTHALDEMDQDDLVLADIEHAILKGDIITRQWDDKFSEWKYVIQGDDLDGNEIEVVAKPGQRSTVVIITVYRI